MKMNKKIKTECCVCRDWKNPEEYNWYTPSTEERREYHYHGFKNLSHSYCPSCYVLNLKEEGLGEEEIEGLVKEVFGAENNE